MLRLIAGAAACVVVSVCVVFFKSSSAVAANKGCVQGELLRYGQFPGLAGPLNAAGVEVTIDPEVATGEVFVVQHVSLGINTGDPDVQMRISLFHANIDDTDPEVLHYLGEANPMLLNSTNLVQISRQLTAYIRPGRKILLAASTNDNLAHDLAAEGFVSGYFARDCAGL